MKKIYFILIALFFAFAQNLVSQNLTYEITDYETTVNSSVNIGNYVFYETEGAVYRIDVSNPKDPGSPVKIDNIAGMDLDYFGKYLYTFDYAGGISLNLYDVSNPLNVNLAGSYTFTEGGVFKLNEKGNKLYILTDANEQTVPKLIVLDISNPQNITKLAEKSFTNIIEYDQILDFQISDDSQTAFFITKVYYWIYNISNLNNITLLANDRPFYPSFTRSIEVIGTDLFIGGWANHQIARYDITDLSKPVKLGFITLASVPHEIYYDGTHLVVIDSNTIQYFEIPMPQKVSKKEKDNKMQEDPILVEYGTVQTAENVYKAIPNENGNVFIQEGGDYYKDYKSCEGSKFKYVKVIKKVEEIYLTTQVMPAEASEAGCKVTPEGRTKQEKNAIVNVIASPASGWRFKEYTGDLTGTDASQQIKMTSNKGVTGHFEKAEEAILTLGSIYGNVGVCASEILEIKKNSIFSGTLTANDVDGWDLKGMSFYITGHQNRFNKALLIIEKNEYTIDYKDGALNSFSCNLAINKGETVNWELFLIPNPETFFGCPLPEIIRNNAVISVDNVNATPFKVSNSKKLPLEPQESGEKYLYCVSVSETQSGESEFAEIKDAIADAKPGATVDICPGTYFEEDLDINKELTLRGSEDYEGVTITRSSDGDIFNIKTESPVKFSTLKIKGERYMGNTLRKIVGFETSISTGNNNLEIDKVEFNDLEYAILNYPGMTYAPINLKVTNSTFKSNFTAITGYFNITIDKCTFNDNTSGIELKSYYNPCNGRISNSHFTNHNNAIIANHVKDMTISDNFFNDNMNTIDCFRSSDVNLINNTIKTDIQNINEDLDNFNLQAIYISEGEFITVDDNKIIFLNRSYTKTAYGIYLIKSKLGTISGNEISGFKYGGYFDNSNFNSIISNQIFYNGCGLYFDESNKNKITSNKIHHNIRGIILDLSDDNEISSNDIYNNGSWNVFFQKQEEKKYDNTILAADEEIPGGLILNNSEAKITNNNFSRDSSAAVILLGNSKSTINFNNFIDNADFAIDNRTDNIINAHNNFWNSPNGPRLTAEGEGERITERVDYQNHTPEIYKFSASFVKDTFFIPINKSDKIDFAIANWTDANNKINYSISDKLSKITETINETIELDTNIFYKAIDYKTSLEEINKVYLTATSETLQNQTILDTAIVVSYPAILYKIRTQPDTLFVKINDIGIIDAYGEDQHSNYVPITPSWSVNGGGTIDSLGTFTAGNVPGTYIASASFEGKTGNTVIIVEDTTSVSVAEKGMFNKINTEIYPNPSCDIFNFNLEVESPNKASVKIYSTEGKVIATLFEGYLTQGGNLFKWDASNNSTGVYLLVIEIENKRYSQSIIKQ